MNAGSAVPGATVHSKFTLSCSERSILNSSDKRPCSLNLYILFNDPSEMPFCVTHYEYRRDGAKISKSTAPLSETRHVYNGGGHVAEFLALGVMGDVDEHARMTTGFEMIMAMIGFPVVLDSKIKPQMLLGGWAISRPDPTAGCKDEGR